MGVGVGEGERDATIFLLCYDLTDNINLWYVIEEKENDEDEKIDGDFILKVMHESKRDRIRCVYIPPFPEQPLIRSSILVSNSGIYSLCGRETIPPRNRINHVLFYDFQNPDNGWINDPSFELPPVSIDTDFRLSNNGSIIVSLNPFYSLSPGRIFDTSRWTQIPDIPIDFSLQYRRETRKAESTLLAVHNTQTYWLMCLDQPIYHLKSLVCFDVKKSKWEIIDKNSFHGFWCQGVVLYNNYLVAYKSYDVMLRAYDLKQRQWLPQPLLLFEDNKDVLPCNLHFVTLFKLSDNKLLLFWIKSGKSGKSSTLVSWTKFIIHKEEPSTSSTCDNDPSRRPLLRAELFSHGVYEIKGFRHSMAAQQIMESSRIETAVEKLTLTPAVKPPRSSSKVLAPPKRPGFGTIGREVVLHANHFLVQVSDKDLYHYDVSIHPKVTSKRICRDIMFQLVKKYGKSHLGEKVLAYDGRKSVYVAGELPFSSRYFIVSLVDKHHVGSSSSNRREWLFKVFIKFASKPDLHHLHQFLRGGQQDAPYDVIQVLDGVLRSHPSQMYRVVGRSFFPTELGRKGELGNGVEYWGGYYQSLRPVQMGLSLNIDISARSFYEPLLVTDFVAKHFNLRNLSRPLSDQDRLKVKRVLRGVKVMLMQRENARTYKITGISLEPLGKLTFSLDDNNTKTSVVQYFRERYGVVLKFLSLPALQAGTDASPIYLPMEVCKIVEGQRYTKKLNEQQVTKLLRATCQRPNERETSIEKIVRYNDYDNKQVVKNFGIQVLQQLCEVDARVLPPPMLKYHDSGRESRVEPRMGQWNMINKKMVNGGRVDYWTCVSFSSQLHPNLPNRFCKLLVDECNSKGMVFKPLPLIPIQTKNAYQIENALTEVHKQSIAKLKSLGNRGRLQLLIIVLPDVTGSYGKIKRICETELGIVSQCCQPRKVQKLSRQYFENLSLKVNVKVGGRNTVLSDAIQMRIPLVSDRPTIIFGADVTHPQPGEDSSPSIAAVVASMDWPEVTKYRGLVSAQTHREEIIEDLYKSFQDPQRGLVHAGLIREHILAFSRSTNMKPHRIIFYRDGVSEGQFSQVLLHEMDAIRKACASLEEGYQPPVTFIVVQKRHHTRLFPTSGDSDKSGNILPGTVIDTKICHPFEFDFYLNSHAGIQGTSRPTHYHVLYDENNFTADQLQMLTNDLCYTYARCTRSVSIVPPAYYAHLAAFRARHYIEGDTSDTCSSVGSSGGGGKNKEVRPLPTIKDDVKDVMFYV